jgi:hypothetical protein
MSKRPGDQFFICTLIRTIRKIGSIAVFLLLSGILFGQQVKKDDVHFEVLLSAKMLKDMHVMQDL